MNNVVTGEKMEEFTKISIHNHLGGSGADRTLNDRYDKSICYNRQEAFNLIDNAKDNGFGLLVLTQANCLPALDYYESKNYAKAKGITLLPGAEFNLKNDEDKYLHTVVVFEDKEDVKLIEKQINEFIFKNKDNYIKMNQFLDLIIDHKCIIAAHGIKQKDNNRSASTNPATFTELINLSDSIPVIIEDNHKYHKKTLIEELRDALTAKELAWVNRAAVVSTADRRKFNEIKSPTYIWGQPSFDDLYYSCFMGETRIKRKSDIINKVNYIDRIVIDCYDNSQLRPLTINCSHGLNTIIGPSGSGKTMLLDIIKRKLTGSGVENKSISKDCNYEEVYSIDKIHIYDDKGKEITENSGYTVVEGEVLYNKVISAYQSDKSMLLKELQLIVDDEKLQVVISNYNTNLNKYISDCIKIRENRHSISKCIDSIDSINRFLNANKDVNSEILNYSKDEELGIKSEKLEDTLKKINEDLDKANESFNSLFNLGKEYSLSNTFTVELELIKEKFNNSMMLRIDALNKDILDLASLINLQNLIYNSVLYYNSIIGEQNKLIIERKQELVKKYTEIKNMLLENVQILLSLKVPVLSKQTIKDSITFKNQEIAKLTFNKVKLTIEKEKFKDAFPSNIGNKPKIKPSKFKTEILDLEDPNSVGEFAQIFIDDGYKNKLQLVYSSEENIDYKIELKNTQGNFENIDSISAGNLSKIYINRMFDEKINSAGSNAIVLYDQPDSNMEKAFILDELIPKISNLRDRNQIFITTHEPLLVVNSDSNNIIVANNDKTAIKANDISYENKSFVGVNSKKELVNEVAKLIDGHPDAVKKRSTVYGGILNGD